MDRRGTQEEKKGEQTGGSAHFSTSERSLWQRGESHLASYLTPREVEVLHLLAQGQTNQQIARNCLISVSTVKRQIQHISAKLGVCDRVQAAVRAIELGLLDERSGG